MTNPNLPNEDRKSPGKVPDHVKKMRAKGSAVGSVDIDYDAGVLAIGNAKKAGVGYMLCTENPTREGLDLSINGISNITVANMLLSLRIKFPGEFGTAAEFDLNQVPKGWDG